MDEAPFPGEVMTDTANFARFISGIWRKPDQEAEARWVDDFAQWMTEEPKEHGTPSALRRLRRAAPRAYDVLYRMLILGDDVASATRWLNERAIRNRIPLPEGREAHYREKDTVALFIVGLDYVRAHW